MNIIYIHTKGTKIGEGLLLAGYLNCLLWHIFPKFLLYFEKYMTCFRDSLSVDLEWYINFLTKQWCKALRRGHGISGKEGPEVTERDPFSAKNQTL